VQEWYTGFRTITVGCVLASVAAATAGCTGQLGIVNEDGGDDPIVDPRDAGILARRDSGVEVPPVDGGVPSPDAGPPGAIRPFDGCEVGGPEAQLVMEAAPPGTLTAATTTPVELTFANCGAAAWMAAPSTDALGVKLGAQSPADNTVWGLGRVLLPGDVPPSHQVTVRFDIVAPADNGTYAFQWQIVDELVRWIEAPTPARTIEVTGGREPPVGVFHPRTAWQDPAQPVTGPAMDLTALRFITIHYPGGVVDVDGADNVYQDDDTARILRNNQSSYLSSRGYSLGYNSAVSIDGAEWEIRGETIRSAANGCQAVNVPGYAIQIITPRVEAPPTAAQTEGVRRVVARVRALAAAAGNPNHLFINGHRDVRPMCGSGGTACPGDPIYALIGSGMFEP
jgi:hypothetical protein